jgi:hypothetical protein
MKGFGRIAWLQTEDVQAISVAACQTDCEAGVCTTTCKRATKASYPELSEEERQRQRQMRRLRRNILSRV